jgi:hypothetical protein
MEDVFSVYPLPYDPSHPVIVMDEKPLQLHGEVTAPIPMTATHPTREDPEYVRHGTCSFFLWAQPLAG